MAHFYFEYYKKDEIKQFFWCFLKGPKFTYFMVHTLKLLICVVNAVLTPKGVKMG